MWRITAVRGESLLRPTSIYLVPLLPTLSFLSWRLVSLLNLDKCTSDRSRCVAFLADAGGKYFFSRSDEDALRLRRRRTQHL